MIPRLQTSLPRFMKPPTTGLYDTAVTYELTAVYETANNRFIWYRGYRRAYRGLWNRQQPVYLIPRLQTSLSRFTKPPTTGLFDTAVADELTAVYETANNRFIWYRGRRQAHHGFLYRGRRQAHRGFLYRVREKPWLTAVYQITPRCLSRKPRFYPKNFSVGCLQIYIIVYWLEDEYMYVMLPSRKIHRRSKPISHIKNQ
jgi:hypothetical protein